VWSNMKKRLQFISILTTLALILPSTVHGQTSSFDHSHALYAKVLSQYVRDGRVDYKSLHKNSEDLMNYMDQMAQVSREEFDQWTRNERMAFLINLYNAQTLKIIVENYPVRNIRMLGVPFLGPWSLAGIKVFGKKISLDHIEHGILRAKYKDPRIHFTLVCAAKSCPPLRNEPFVPDRLEEQLDDQGRDFMREPKKNRIDKERKTLYLTSIVSFYRGDFPSGGEALARYFWQFFDPSVTANEDPADYRVRYTSYDWSINQV
jgi:hypothetical protein